MEDQSQTPSVADNATSPELAPQNNINMLEGLPEDLRNDPNIKDFKTPEDLVKSYISAQRMLGGSIRIPGEDASEESRLEFYKRLESVPGITRLPDPSDKEALDQFYNKLGRPESPESYTYNIPEGMEANPEAVHEFSKLAYDLGLTQQQAAKLAEYDLGRAQAQAEQMQASKDNATQVLKETWGHDYDNRMQSAKAVVEAYSKQHPDAVKDLINGPAGNNPALLTMLSDLGKALNETGILQGQPKLQFGVTPEEARMQLDDIMSNRSHAYWDDTNPSHREAVERVYKLNQSIIGE